MLRVGFTKQTSPSTTEIDRLDITGTSSDEDTATASDCDSCSTDDERTDTASEGHEAS